MSANTISRLKRDWAKEYEGWKEAALDDEPIVYIWADGVHSGLRGEEDKLCALVIVGVTARGKKRFLAIEDGGRESTQSWREVLLSLKDRGMNAPKLAIGDGAMGFWAALEESYPETRQQRCWQHKTMNVLNCFPKLSVVSRIFRTFFMRRLRLVGFAPDRAVAYSCICGSTSWFPRCASDGPLPG